MLHMVETAARSTRALILIIVMAGIAVHAVGFALYYPGDVNFYLLPWYGHIVEAGPIGAFRAPFGNYSPPYLYLLAASTLVPTNDPVIIIKLLSLLGGMWLTVAGYRLMVACSKPRPEIAALLLFLPTVTLNTSILSQTDTFWVAPCMLSLAAALRRRSFAMVVWAGVAFAFKVQAIFFAPFVMLMLIRLRAHWSHWLVPGAIYILALTPAWLAGWPASDLATIYLRQATWQPEMGQIFTGNGPGWWTLYGYFAPDRAVRQVALACAVGAGAAIAYLLFLRKQRLSPEQLVAAATLSAAMLVWTLPRMHERYLILADVLAVCWAMIAPSRKSICTAVLLQLASVSAILGFMYQIPVLTGASPFLAAGGIWLLMGRLGKSYESGVVPLHRDNPTPVIGGKDSILEGAEA